jgi:hypothetical protein
VCLVARHLEGLGLPTLVLASAWDIVQAGKPPRIAFVDYPLGHTSGRPHDPADQLAVVRDAIEAFPRFEAPGGFIDLDHVWSADEAWKVEAAGDDGGDQRQPRDLTPRYQSEADRLLAEARLAGG